MYMSPLVASTRLMSVIARPPSPLKTLTLIAAVHSDHIPITWQYIPPIIDQLPSNHAVVGMTLLPHLT